MESVRAALDGSSLRLSGRTRPETFRSRAGPRRSSFPICAADSRQSPDPAPEFETAPGPEALPRVTLGLPEPILTTVRLPFVKLMVLAFVAALSTTALARDPFGYWLTIDDDGKTPKGVVQIFKRGDKAYGKIVKLINPPEPNPRCTECSGSRKDQPVLGMVILRNLEEDGDEWSGGRILDPQNGKEYSCYIEVQSKGNTLKVRGYLGLALLGRTQYWRRAKAP